MSDLFYGWYIKCQSETETLAYWLYAVVKQPKAVVCVLILTIL